MSELPKENITPFDQEKYEAAGRYDPLLTACNYSFSLPVLADSDLAEFDNQGKPVLLNKKMIAPITELFEAASNFKESFRQDCKISSGYRTIEQLEKLRNDRYYFKLIETFLEKRDENDPIKKMAKALQAKESEQERLIRYFGLRKNPELEELKKKYEGDSDKFLATVDPSMREDLKKEALHKVDQSVPYAGRSDHHTGLAVDLPHVIVDFDFYHWLEDNAYNYGFIRRYTEETQKYTRVDPEIWHWRYVGKNHAQKIHELGETIDDYILNRHYEGV